MERCSHTHHHSSLPQGGRVLTLLFILYLTYLVAEVFGGIISGSLALLADAGHMAIDTASIALSLFALWISSKPPTSGKTYGYYRAEILAALVNGASLIAVAFWILWEAWRRTFAPVEIHAGLMTVVASGGLLVNIVGLLLISKSSQTSLGLKSVWWHMLSDTLGSISATLAGGLVWKFHWTAADPILSVFIAALVLRGSWKLLSDCVNVLLEGVPKGVDTDKIKLELESLEHIKEVHDLHVWSVASGMHALSAHICLSGEGVNHSGVLDSVTRLLKEKHKIEHITVQLEPPTFSHRKMHF